jgi:hypothetical protein
MSNGLNMLNMLSTSNNIIISNIDLLNKRYDESILINNIHRLSLETIVRSQKKLSKEFIDNYILSDKYVKFPEDDITINTLYMYQPYYFSKK